METNKTNESHTKSAEFNESKPSLKSATVNPATPNHDAQIKPAVTATKEEPKTEKPTPAIGAVKSA